MTTEEILLQELADEVVQFSYLFNRTLREFKIDENNREQVLMVQTFNRLSCIADVLDQKRRAVNEWRDLMDVVD
jgi:hypothetical protein